MIQEEKELLLKDICARLPYGVKLNWKFLDNTSKDEELKELSDLDIWWITKATGVEVKPYLRPMSSMAEEEKKEFESLGWRVDELDGNVPWNYNAYNVFDGIDWLNKNMFDYRGLIKKGLALEAKEGMHKTK